LPYRHSVCQVFPSHERFVCLALAMSKVNVVLGLFALAMAADSVAFGPENCVSLSRSTQGTCVINTNCEGKSTEKFEFAFDCATTVASKAQVQRHSFGEGGFDDVEEFDTEVQCQECVAPGGSQLVSQAASGLKVAKSPAKMVEASTPLTPATVSQPKVQAAAASATHSFMAATSQAEASTQTSKVEAKKKMWPFSDSDAPMKASVAPSGKVVSFGPSDCVATYKNGEGHCVLQTSCDEEKRSDETTWSAYEFGLICVDTNGVPVRHSFGKDSFDTTETFDTLIECDQCMGLDEVSEDVALTGQVVVLADEIKSMSGMMKNITSDVTKLNEKVFPAAAKAEGGNTSKAEGGNTSKAENKTAVAEAAPAEDATALTHRASETKTMKQHIKKTKAKAATGHRHHRHVADKAAAKAQDDDDDEFQQAGSLKKHALRHHAKRHVTHQAQHKKNHHRREQEEEEQTDASDEQQEEQAEEEAPTEDEQDTQDDEASAPATPEDEDISPNEDAVVAAVVSHKHRGKRSPLSRHRHDREEEVDDEADTDTQADRREDQEVTDADGQDREAVESEGEEGSDDEVDA